MNKISVVLIKADKVNANGNIYTSESLKKAVNDFNKRSDMYKIMESANYYDSKWYTAECQCGSDECNLHLNLDVDKQFEDISLCMYQNLYYRSYWGETNWFTEKWHRITGALRLLFTGYIKIQSEFRFNGEKQINDFTSSLQKGMQELREQCDKE
jgi:hypothetical protein